MYVRLGLSQLVILVYLSIHAASAARCAPAAHCTVHIDRISTSPPRISLLHEGILTIAVSIVVIVHAEAHTVHAAVGFLSVCMLASACGPREGCMRCVGCRIAFLLYLALTKDNARVPEKPIRRCRFHLHRCRHRPFHL
jgi:hypothetical protein